MMTMQMPSMILRRAGGMQPQRHGFSSSSASIEDRFRPLLRLLGYYGAESQRGRQAETLLRSCAMQSSHPNWKKYGKIDTDQFMSSHQLFMAHVWIVHRRLHNFPKAELSSAKLLQEVLFDELWEDTTRRIRKLNVVELSVDKHLQTVQKHSFAAAVEYDNALQKDDSATKLDDLAAAVWRHIYQSTTPEQSPNFSPELCIQLAQYLIDQLDKTNQVLPADFLENKFSWIKPNFFVQPSAASREASS